MGNIEIKTALEQIKELDKLIMEAEQEREALRDMVKAEFSARGTSEIIAGPYKAVYKAIQQTRLDTKALRAELPEVAERYTKNAEYMRLTIN